MGHASYVCLMLSLQPASRFSFLLLFSFTTSDVESSANDQIFHPHQHEATEPHTHSLTHTSLSLSLALSLSHVHTNTERDCFPSLSESARTDARSFSIACSSWLSCACATMERGSRMHALALSLRARVLFLCVCFRERERDSAPERHTCTHMCTEQLC